MAANPCPACQGARLKPESLAVTVGERNIHAVTQMSVVEALAWVEELQDPDSVLSERERTIAYQILKEIRSRLTFLVDVGVDYLTLDRATGSLSGRRGPAIASGHSDRLQPDGRPLRLRRALHRPAPGGRLAPHRHPPAAARPGQHRAGGGARRGHHPRRRSRHRPGARRRRAGGLRGGGRDAGRRDRLPPVHHRPVPQRRPRDPPAPYPSRRQRSPSDHPRRPREQPQEHRGAHPAGQVRLRHRRLGLRQEHAGGRHPLQEGGPASLRRPRPPRRVRRHHRPGAHRQGGGHRPVAHRPHAALQPRHLHRRLHPHPRALRLRPRGAPARLPARPLLVQRHAAAAARPARARATSRSRCSSCPT